jgi:hypothetical protein
MGPKFSLGRKISFKMSGTHDGYGIFPLDLATYSNNRLVEMIDNGNEIMFPNTNARERRLVLRISVSFFLSPIFS